MAKKLSKKDFTLKLIDVMRKPYTNKKGETVDAKGIHTVYTKVEGDNFNQMWREYFGDDPIVGLKALVADGVIQSHPARGGAMIYKQGDMPAGATSDGKKGLSAIGIA